MSTPERIEELLAHTGWARKLARSLVADPNAADDLVQDAWIAALEGGYRRGDSTKGWLARVMRNLASQRGRSERARERRERTTARGEATADEAELVGRAQLEVRLANLVLELDEPSRQVVLLRYFEGLDGAEIGRRLGVPAATVRSRLARAIEKLRARLDDEHAGRERWTNAFVLAFASDARTTHVGSAAGAAGGMLVLAKVLAVVVTTAAIGTGAWLAMRTSDAPSVEAETKLAVVKEEDASLVADVVTPSRAADAPSNVDAAAPTPHDDRAIVRGRFVTSDGTPVGGVAVELHPNPPDLARGLVVAEDVLRGVRSSSTADGRFELACAPDERLAYEVRFHATGFARGAIACSRPELRRELRAGRTVELGAIRLDRGATLRARVVDASGNVLATGWTIEAAQSSRGFEPWVRATTGDPSGATRVQENGVWRFDDLPRGTWSLVARHACGLGTSSVRVDLTVGSERDIDLLYTGPDPERSIVVTVVERTRTVRDLAATSIVLRGSTGTRTPEPDAMSRSRYVFTDVPPDAYTLTVDDARFRPWSSNDVVPGRSVWIALRGAATIEWHVRSQASAPETEAFAVHASVLPTATTPVRLPNEPLEPGSTMDVVPGSYSWVVRIADVGERPIEVRDLVAHERRAIDLVVADDTRVEGRVVEADGTTPVAGAHVGVFVPTSKETSSAAMPGYVEVSARAAIGTLLKETRADAGGRFVFERIPPGRVLVHVDAGAGRAVQRRDVDVRSGAPGEELVIAMPPGARISGRLLAPAGARFDTHRVEVRPKTPDDERGWRFTDPWSSASRASIASDGSFELAHLGAGKCVVELVPDAAVVGRELPDLDAASCVIHLDEIEVAVGDDVTREYDVREHFPGAIDVVVRENGRPFAAGRVYVARSPGQFGDSDFMPTDASGRVRIEGLPAGEWYVYARGLSDLWTAQPSSPVRVPPAGLVTVPIELELALGTVRIVDADTSAPLAGKDLAVLTEFAAPNGTVRRTNGRGITTDANGDVQLELPIGKARVDWQSSLQPGSARQGDLEWTRSGPVPAVLRLKPAPPLPTPKRR